MSNYKEIIIEWLVQNEAIALDIIQKSKIKLEGIDPVFIEIAKDQEFEENKRLLINEMSRSVGINPDKFHEVVDDSELGKYFKRLE